MTYKNAAEGEEEEMESISFFYQYPSLNQCQKEPDETIPPVLAKTQTNKQEKKVTDSRSQEFLVINQE